MISKKQNITTITEKDLPLFCPPDDANSWAMHPRVFMEIKSGGTSSCPYCGNTYKLKGSHPN